MNVLYMAHPNYLPPKETLKIQCSENGAIKCIKNFPTKKGQNFQKKKTNSDLNSLGFIEMDKYDVKDNDKEQSYNYKESGYTENKLNKSVDNNNNNNIETNGNQKDILCYDILFQSCTDSHNEKKIDYSKKKRNEHINITINMCKKKQKVENCDNKNFIKSQYENVNQNCKEKNNTQNYKTNIKKNEILQHTNGLYNWDEIKKNENLSLVNKFDNFKSVLAYNNKINDEKILNNINKIDESIFLKINQNYSDSGYNSINNSNNPNTVKYFSEDKTLREQINIYNKNEKIFLDIKNVTYKDYLEESTSRSTSRSNRSSKTDGENINICWSNYYFKDLSCESSYKDEDIISRVNLDIPDIIDDDKITKIHNDKKKVEKRKKDDHSEIRNDMIKENKLKEKKINIKKIIDRNVLTNFIECVNKQTNATEFIPFRKISKENQNNKQIKKNENSKNSTDTLHKKVSQINKLEGNENTINNHVEKRGTQNKFMINKDISVINKYKKVLLPINKNEHIVHMSLSSQNRCKSEILQSCQNKFIATNRNIVSKIEKKQLDKKVNCNDGDFPKIKLKSILSSQNNYERCDNKVEEEYNEKVIINKSKNEENINALEKSYTNCVPSMLCANKNNQNELMPQNECAKTGINLLRTNISNKKYAPHNKEISHHEKLKRQNNKINSINIISQKNGTINRNYKNLPNSNTDQNYDIPKVDNNNMPTISDDNISNNFKENYEYLKNYFYKLNKTNTSINDYFLNLFCYTFMKKKNQMMNSKSSNENWANNIQLHNFNSKENITTILKQSDISYSNRYTKKEQAKSKIDKHDNNFICMDKPMKGTQNLLKNENIYKHNNPIDNKKKNSESNHNVMKTYQNSLPYCRDTKNKDTINAVVYKNTNKNDNMGENYNNVSNIENSEIKNILYSFYNYLKLKDYIIPHNIYNNSDKKDMDENNRNNNKTDNYKKGYNDKENHDFINISYNFIDEHKNLNNNIRYDNFCSYHKRELNNDDNKNKHVPKEPNNCDSSRNGIDISKHTNKDMHKNDYLHYSNHLNQCFSKGGNSNCFDRCPHRFYKKNVDKKYNRIFKDNKVNFSNGTYFYLLKNIIENLDREELQKLMICQTCYILKKIKNKITPIDVILDTQILFYDCNTYFKKKGWIDDTTSKENKIETDGKINKNNFTNYNEKYKNNGNLYYSNYQLNDFHKGKNNVSSVNPNNDTVGHLNMSNSVQMIYKHHRDNSDNIQSDSIPLENDGDPTTATTTYITPTKKNVQFYNIGNREISRTSTTTSISHKMNANHLKRDELNEKDNTNMDNNKYINSEPNQNFI
ncbi:conserved Plasmodium protein, unknown function [Plasmodium yoelii]|uniref:Uncharacterized protein n=2 Tax=Plasmodium yoelii TaxID=5861 RepID=A0AAE9X0P0_PLAYO|nr:conserved Plasmodium protein, unknown function [Plasmodium yoelii]WBY59959.1 hypothetical protein Py17XNL_001303579 [Plasmodium yoelii yoelii]CDU19900.1 conserved Plasmodium protein, unknown function [Plasmodium yoelii]VTZ80657.1 conserved Plasmodium protein, unknown function [Plasmodium yoelii]|eukprot:XP_022813582.1 conserved Plasmodium protein, unknown function [Plasmodium yoelii]